jgi:hypothetical protein
MMRPLHGSWLTHVSNDDRAFALWAETSDTYTDIHAHQHPFALSSRDLRPTLKELASSINDLLKRGVKETMVTLRLPSTRNAPQPSLAILRDAESTVVSL